MFGQVKAKIFTLKPEVGAASSLHCSLTAGLVIPFCQRLAWKCAAGGSNEPISLHAEKQEGK